MNTAEYIVDYLIRLGVTDAFGIPGGVILDFLYALDKRSPEITPHLMYHEQGAVFAACGYAQVHGKLGVAYATRGPGITNMVTGIADAYYDSIPLLVITAHSSSDGKTSMRIETDQEMNPLPMISKITKYAARVERTEDAYSEIERACTLALAGRPGPVLLDFHTTVLQAKVDRKKQRVATELETSNNSEIVEVVRKALALSRRPVLLIGNGIRQAGTTALLEVLVEKMRVPVVSSRVGQDIIPNSPYYFGFIGSHGIRYSNFILSKADLIIAIGNRMSFPIESQSFRPIVERAKTIRIDVDENEFNRQIPNSQAFYADLRLILPCLMAETWKYHGMEEWLSVCHELKRKLQGCDINEPVARMMKVLNRINQDVVIISDVGNHEFWLSHAYSYSEIDNRILYSNSFGTLGCAIGKAIGAYYCTGKPVICFAGDQGIQMNIQEFQFIAVNLLPIRIVIINNQSSGMIRSRQRQKYQSRFLHTTGSSGYSVPDFKAIAEAYGIKYYSIEQIENMNNCADFVLPCLIELKIDEDNEITTSLLPGKSAQRLSPELSETEFQNMDEL